jgi:hypothetical protein
MNLTIGLTFGIFMPDNGEVSWSMWVLLLWTSYDFPSLMCIQNCMMSIFIQVPFAIYLLLCCNISDFSWWFLSFDMHKFNDEEWVNMPTCNLLKVCITSGCNNWGFMALVSTQWHLMITFGLSNNLHCINNICEGVQLVVDLIGMNCCWGGHNGFMIMLD